MRGPLERSDAARLRLISLCEINRNGAAGGSVARFDEEPRTASHQAKAFEARGAEQEPHLARRVVVDRNVEHDLIAQVPERPLDADPERESGARAPGRAPRCP